MDEGGAEGQPLVAAIIRAGAVLHAELDRSLREHGLHPADLEVLRLLAARPGLSPTLLAQRLRVRRQSMRRQLDSLVEAEVLDLTEDPDDLRAKAYWLTGEGRSRLKLASAALEDLERAFLGSFPSARAAELSTLLLWGVRAVHRDEPRTIFSEMR